MIEPDHLDDIVIERMIFHVVGPGQLGAARSRSHGLHGAQSSHDTRSVNERRLTPVRHQNLPVRIVEHLRQSNRGIAAWASVRFKHRTGAVQ